MRIKRTLFFSLILFLIIFSISFVSANEITTNDVNTNELSALSVSTDVQTDECLNDVCLDSGDNQNLDEISLSSNEESSTSDQDLKDGTSNIDEIEEDEFLSDETDEYLSSENNEYLTNNGKVPTLQANPLGQDQYLDYNGNAQNIIDAMVAASNSGGGTVYLYGHSFSGVGGITANQNQIIRISNVRVVGGSPTNSNLRANLTQTTGNYALNFRGYSEGVYLQNAGRWTSQYFNTSGVYLENVTFENLDADRLVGFCSGSLVNVTISNCTSYKQFMGMVGSYHTGTPIPIINCTFINCHQTYPGDDGMRDGTGQFGAVFGIRMENTSFINTTSGQHGGALCIADESDWGCLNITSTLKNCSFINITSRWFAIYIHGNFSTTETTITSPQIIEDCKFVNCTGWGEYSACIGLSHSNVIIRDSEFTNLTGGQGTAIMVGGLDPNHEAFAGRNTVANNVTIERCNFTNCIAKEDGQAPCLSPETNRSNGQLKHGDIWFYPTGDAGAIFVHGNDTNIIDCIFSNNEAQDGNGAAIYIVGQNTTIIGSEFYNHTSENGTVYLVGNDCEIRDSYFHDNNASSSGACIYIEGNNAEISNTTFINNTAPNGGCIYIVGDNTKIDNDTKFISNNATNGAGVYVNGSNTVILNTSFINNTAVNGAGALINGEDTDVNRSYFEGNNATNGGGIFVEGDITILSNNTFIKNNVTNQGGAVYLNGHNSQINYNNFTNNEAVPLSEDEETGLGGAIFVNGNQTVTNGNVFTHNKARNGSAIYTDGDNFRLHNDIFYENQAWSYLLVITAVPPESLYHSQDVEINVVHRAGDNIINAIHNRASPDEVHFRNVTFVHSNGNTITTDSTRYVEPVDGVENSQEGTLLYQDDREDYQLIQLKVTHEDGEIFYQNTTMITNIYGNVNVTLPRTSLRKGLYIVDAEHVEDWNYKFIVNATTFRILDAMDVSINKTSDADEYFQDEIAAWNITVTNAGNGTDAEYVTITDFLPDTFNLTSLNFTFYNATNGAWTNGTLYLNNSTLSYGVYNKSGGNWIYGDANYDPSTNTWKYYFFEMDDDTIVYTEFHEEDFTDRFGQPIFRNSSLICYDNVSYRIDNEEWYYETITVDGQEIKYGIFNETHFTQYFGNARYDAENKSWVFVKNVTDPQSGETTELYTWYNETTGYWIIGYEVFAPERRTLTQKVNLTINEEPSKNLTNIILGVRDFDKSNTAVVLFETNCTKAGTYNNIVNVTTPDYDWDLSNNEDNKTVLVDPLPNKTVSNSTPYYGDFVEYNLTIKNTGNETYAHDLIVIDSLPEGLEYNETVAIIGADQVGETIVDGQKITWTVTNITAFTNATIIVKVRVHALGNLTNNMTLVAPSGFNRTVNATITPVDFTDVYVNKSVEKEEYFVDDIVIWTITVSVANNGSNATNVTLKDILPSEVEFINASIGTYDNVTGVLEIGFMENGTSVTLTITSRAKIVANNVTNNATVNCTETEWDYDNNFDNATIDILPNINKTANNTAPDYHEYVDYNLTIINEGDNVYADVLTVIDSLPDGLVYNNTVGIYGAVQVGDVVQDGQVITWRVTNIAAHTNATIVVRVRADAIGTLVNNYTLIGPKGSNRTVNETIVVNPVVDISVNKTVERDEYKVNETVVWTITVYNANNGTNATNVLLKDILPKEVEFVSYTATNGTYDNETGIWDIGFMGNGTNATLTIISTAKTPKYNITNNATVNCTEDEWDYDNNFDNATISIIPIPHKTVNNTNPIYHEIIEYNLTVVNYGDENYTDNITVIDSMEDGLEFLGTVSITGADVVVGETVNGQVVTWVLTNISTSNATITVRVRANATGQKLNNLTIRTPKGTNMTVNVTVNVDSRVDLSVNKTVEKEEYKVNETVVWTITVYNAGNGTNATNVLLKDILPGEVEFVSYTATNGTYDNETGIWDIGFMGNGTNATLTIVSTAKTPKYNITNNATVNCSETEWDYDNNFDDASINIIPTIDKTVNNTNPYYHETVDYNLTIINYGDEIYTDNLTVIDSMQDGLFYIDTISVTGADLVSFNRSEDGQVLTWVITNISTSNATITVRVRADAVGDLENNFTLITPKGTNMTVNRTITVEPIVDVSVVKTVEKEEYKVNETVVWTITVYNANNGTNATNVLLKDILPGEVEFVSYTATNGTYDNETGIWDIGFMGNGTNATLTIISTAKTPKYNITNNATVNCTEDEWDYDNNFDDATINIIPTIDKTVNNTHPYYHEIVEYNLTIINNGNDLYTDNLTVIDSMQYGLEFTGDFTITGADMVSVRWGGGQVIEWVITNISTSNAVITVKVRANAVGDLENNFTLITPKGTNMTVNRTITVEPIVDVSVVKTVEKDEYKVNETVVWTITVYNADNGTSATNVLLKDILPGEVEFVSYTATNGTYDNETGIWDIGFMGNGTNATLTIISTAKTPKYNITNNATVNCTEDEWDYDNNYDNATISIIPIPHKTVNNTNPIYHEIIEYNLTVVNYGDEKYTDNITVIDSMEDGLEFLGTVSITGADVVVGETVNGQVVTWVLTNISTSNATITVRVRANATGQKLNNLTIRTPKGTNMTVNVTVNVDSRVDLSVNKTVEKEEYKVNETVIWTITVYNADNGTNATNVLLKDILPKEVEFVSYSATNGTYDNGTGIWDIGFMGNGTNATLTIVSIAVTTKYNVTNNATVNCSETEWDYDNNFDDATINIIPTIDKTVNNTHPYYHEIVEYNLTIINNGDDIYTDNLTVIDTMQYGLEFTGDFTITGADMIGVSWGGGPIIRWVITNISTSNAVITVKVRANAVGDLENNFTLITPKGTNMTVNRTITVEPIVDVSVNKTVEKDEYKVNETVVWTITVYNANNGTDATNVTLKDILPKEVEFVSYTATNGTYDNGTGIWDIGFMGNGTNATLTIVSTAKTPKYNITNNATVNCSETEWDYDNNFDDASISIIPTIDKTVNNTNPYYHETVDYNLTVINYGDAVYTDNLTVIDSMQDGLFYIDTISITGADLISSDISADGQVLTWVITNISTSNAVITVRVRADAVGDLENNFTLITPKGTNMTVNRTITVEPIVDVSVNKTVEKDEYKVNETVVWTITVYNANNGTDATNVTLKDILPKEVEFVSYTATNGTYDNGTGIWDIGFMGNGTNATLTIISTAKTPKYNVTNNATVNCTETEWDYDNNFDDATISIIPTIDKTVNETNPSYHATVDYNLTVINYGDAVYTDNLTLIDSMQTGLTYIETVSISGADLVSFNISEDGQVLTWVITNISTSNAVITVRVRADDLGELENNFTLITPKGNNMTVNRTIIVEPKVDISVNKTVEKEEYKVNETVVWTITVYDAYNGTGATNVTLKDILPGEVEFVSYTATNGTYDNGTGIWYIGNMSNGTNATLTIVSIAKTPKYNITNNATVNCTELEWDYDNNFDDATINIIPTNDKTVNNTNPDYHEIVEYNLTVINYGDAVYTDNLTLIDSMQDGLTFIETVSITGADLISSDISADGQVLTWVITNISTSNAVITVKVRADAVGDLENNFTIKTPKGTNMTVNRTITVEPIVDVSVNKTVEKEEYKVNETVIWTITVYNADNGTNATNVTLKDILPVEVEFVSYTATNGTYDNVSGVWDIGFMGNGTNATLTIVSKAVTTKYNITNNATVNCTEKEWDYTNNFDNATISIIPTNDKVANESEVDYHKIVEYNLTVINNGDSRYTDNVTLIDSMQDGLTFIETVSIVGADVVVGETRNGQVITWVLTNISTSNAVVTVRVRADAVGDLENNFTIKTPKGTNNTVNTTIKVNPIVDVSVKKTSDKNEYFVDGIAIWTITVSNAGNGTNATNVRLSDLLPSEFGFINYTASKGTYNKTSGIWTIGFMKNGTSEKLVIRSYAKTKANKVTNVANVSCDEKEWNYTNNIANKTVKISDIPDLNKTVNDSKPFYNDTVVYSLKIKNVGNVTYTDNLLVIDSMPNGLKYLKTVSISGAKLVKEVVDGQKITWTITNIPAKSTAVIKVKVKVLALGNLTNNLTIIGPRGTNKTVNCTIDPIPWADLAVVKTSDHFGIDCHNDTTVVWTIKVTNYGPNTAVNSIAKDILPAGLVYISDDTNGKYDPETGVWTIGDLKKGKTVVMHITTKVDAIDTVINNPVVVSSDTRDPDKSNNRDNSSIKVISVADLELIKESNVTKVKVKENFTYLITVINHGPDTAINARAFDKLPKGLKLLGFEASKGDYDPETGKWSIGDLKKGEKVTLRIDVMALVTGNVVNEARVESDTFDNDTSNNNDSVTVVVVDDHIPMRHTGNPFMVCLLSLIAIVGISLRRKI